MMKELTMQELVALCKNRGFVYAGSEIYGGLSNSWDYGPLGVELKNNIKSAWWREFIQRDPNNVGLDSAIIMNPKVWEASGHLAGFSDPLMDCRACKSRHRADKLIENWIVAQQQSNPEARFPSPEAMSDEEMQDFIAEHKIVCPECGKCDFTPIRKFNLMFKTFIGVTEDAKGTVYLRPETCAGIFTNFKNVMRSTRGKLPLGIGQIGKSFRNEITPGNFIFRTREFEQMELEFFCNPKEGMQWFSRYRETCMDFAKRIGLSESKLRYRDHEPEELCFYSQGTTDIEYRYPFGWSEMWGIAYRTDYDLTQHGKFSGEDMYYTDPFTAEKFIPHVVEPSVGVDRLLLAVLCDAYRVEQLGEDDSRVVMGFRKSIAPIKCAVLPLSKKLEDKASEVFRLLAGEFRAEYDVTGSIGKRYRRQDEIGTPYCITVDFDTLEDNSVTIRDRDTMDQVRVAIPELVDWLSQNLKDN
ncbi:MAG: glycine--tRNA ligase [Clostridia bacterium]|nr:glycine--tRNA ligase [Clostridia bacterium]